MKSKKGSGKIHLWELQNLQPYCPVKEEDKGFLPPSPIQQIAENQLPARSLQRIHYDALDKSVFILEM